MDRRPYETNCQDDWIDKINSNVKSVIRIITDIFVGSFPGCYYQDMVSVVHTPDYL